MIHTQLFSFADGLSLLFWAILLWLLGRTIKSKFSHLSLNRFFYAGWGFRIFFALVFALIYLYVLGGGDINAYWDAATVLNKLFINDPMGYVQEMWSTDRTLGVTHHFTSATGFPPGWIWRELEAWNASKILSVFSILTFNSFWATTVLIASLVFFISWLLTIKIVEEIVFNKHAVVFAFLFFPSVTFWCSGISKDSQVYALALLLIYQLFLWLKWGKRSIVRVLFILLNFYILFNLRHFIAIAVITPFVLAMAVRFGNRWSNKPIILSLFRMGLYSVVIIGFIFLSNLDQTQALIKEAQITQADFSQNPIYTGAKYEIDQMDGSLTGLIQAVPNAVFIALYRPLITEPIGTNFFINQLESLMLIIFTVFFFLNRSLFVNLRYLFKNEFALYALTFVLITAFMAGYTSILFGVLVRIRAIALPFFFLILTMRKPKENAIT